MESAAATVPPAPAPTALVPPPMLRILAPNGADVRVEWEARWTRQLERDPVRGRSIGWWPSCTRLRGARGRRTVRSRRCRITATCG